MSHRRVLSGENDYLIERVLTTRRVTDGVTIPAEGLTGGIGYISATEGGPAIDPLLSVAMVERASKPGTYYAVLQGEDILTLLETYDGRTVWECVQFASDYQEFVRVPVRLVRVGR